MTDETDRIDESTGSDSDKDNTESNREKVRDFSFLRNPAVWTAIFTAILTVFTYLLWYVANNANETTKQSQRAFLNFSGISPIVSLTGADQKRIGVEVQVLWTNSGTTPADQRLTRANAQLWQSELPEGFDFKDLKASEDIPLAIGPKANGGARMVIPINMLQAQRGGTSRLYVWGWTVYKDVFSSDPDRLTEFCTEIVQVAVPTGKTLDDPGATVGWNLAQCQHNNCYDQNCKDFSARIKEARTN